VSSLCSIWAAQGAFNGKFTMKISRLGKSNAWSMGMNHS
jgi:hypothetical protein